jgi:hypothetical protein
MSKIFIRANSPHGLPSVARAGRIFSAGETREVEIIDGDDEPTVTVQSPAGPAQQPDPNRMTKKSLEAIKADTRFSILSNPKAEQDLAASNAENETLRKRVAELEAQLGQRAGAGGEGASAGGEDEGKHGRRPGKGG